MKFRFLAACAFFETTSLRLRTVVVCNKKVPRKLAQQMQIVDEQIKLARLRCNLTLRKWPGAHLSQKRGSRGGTSHCLIRISRRS